MTRKLLVADLLCGAGGSSTGCLQALRSLGYEVDLVCVNHWPVAIDTHTRNHPAARHYCQDIASVRPHIVVPEGWLDLLMASPSCTHHSVARGGKPTSDQQRSDPWHIVTWLTELDVARIIIENVWEFRHWGPVDAATGKPIKARRGEYFEAWLSVLRQLGYVLEYRKLNAADFGEATTRQRFIMFGRKDGKPIVWPQPTHGEGRARPWRPARDIIDWRIKGKSIFGRKKPLSPKTLARIEAGMTKHGWPEPFLVVLRNHMDGKSVDEPVPTIAANGNHIGLAQPIVLANRNNNVAKDVGEPLPCLTTAHGGGIFVAEPLILPTGQAPARDAGEPLHTITTGGAGTEGRPGCARPMLVEPFILNRHGDNGSVRAHAIDAPAPTADCRGAGYLVEPFVLSQASGGAARATSAPLPTMTTDGAIALIAPYYGSGSGETCNSVGEPLPTVTAKPRFGLVVPLTHSDSSNRARDVDSDPLPTLTTANRGELAFITAAFGEREGQAPRVHSVDAPTPAICATGHVNLVEATSDDGTRYDILFRMLEPHELAAAMGFSGEDQNYEFAGNKTEKVKQIGNAVSVRLMKACVIAMMSDHPSMFAAAAE
ncbi:DNA cytosine methyltransferase [Rubrivivax sp. JA1024]|nr:DNA cytosine methyltransferase [Rubrivivax sp. JA1024]